MRKLLSLLLVALGIGGGAALGVFLKPVDEAELAAKNDRQPSEAFSSSLDVTERNYVKVGRQTIIPVVQGGETKALMLFELAIDVPASKSPQVHDMEPRIRDAFLRELFRYSHSGAFLQNFTDDRIIDELRRSLTRTAKNILGDEVNEVLILDMMRQEI